MHRVEFKTDAKNERARAALAAIPAEFEGIHRKHMVVRDGERRDSAWYAVIDDDWPEVKAALERQDRRASRRLRAARYPLRDWSKRNEQRQRDRTRPRRLGRRRPPRGARRRAARRRRRARPPLRARPGDRRGRRGDRAGAVGRARQRRDAARRARPARAALLRPPAADVHARARARAARRRLGGGHRRERRGARARLRARRRRSACGRSTSPTPTRTLYHAGAAIASNYLVTLYRAASRLFEDAGAPPEALVPLMTRTIENGFELTGPIARGDWAVVDAHLARAARRAPGARADVPRARGGDARREDHAHDRRDPRGAAPTGEVGLVPTMGAYHAGHLSLFAAAREENDLVVASLFVNPAQFGDPRRPRRATRATRRADAAIAEEAGVDVLFAPARRGALPAGLRDLGRRRAGVAAASRATTGPATSAASRPICLKLFNIVRPRRAYFGQKDAQQVEVVRRMIRDLDLDARAPRAADRPRRRRARALLAQRAALARASASARSPSRARSRRATRRARARAARRPRRRLRRGRAVRPARPRRRRPRRLRPPDRQRPPRKEDTA